MYQLSFEFALDKPGAAKCDPAECRTCKTVGRWRHADCGQCRKEERQNAKRRYWTAVGRDRCGQEKTAAALQSAQDMSGSDP